MDTNVITEIIKEDDDKKIDDVNNKGMKRKERLEQNRISARESRKRKKSMIGELQRTVIKLSRYVTYYLWKLSHNFYDELLI